MLSTNYIDKNILICETDRMFGLGDAIRKIRKNKGLSLAQLHEITGVSTNTLSKIERGSNFEKKTLDQISAGLGVSLNDIFSQMKSEEFESSKPGQQPAPESPPYICKNPKHAKLHAMLDDILNEAPTMVRVGTVSNIVYMHDRIKPGARLPEEFAELEELASIPEPTVGVQRSDK